MDGRPIVSGRRRVQTDMRRVPYSKGSVSAISRLVFSLQLLHGCSVFTASGTLPTLR